MSKIFTYEVGMKVSDQPTNYTVKYNGQAVDVLKIQISSYSGQLPSLANKRHHRIQNWQ